MQGPTSHHGRSSRDFIDAELVLLQVGLKKGDVLLDAGSGDGYWSVAASKLVGTHGKVWAVDFHRPSLDSLTREIFVKGLRNIHPLLADVTQTIPVSSVSVDVCLMVNVLHDLKEEGAAGPALAEMLRMLRPGGLLAVVEFKVIDGPPGPPIEVRIPPEQVEQLCTATGFRKKDQFEAGPYNYAMVFTKA